MRVTEHLGTAPGLAQVARVISLGDDGQTLLETLGSSGVDYSEPRTALCTDAVARIAELHRYSPGTLEEVALNSAMGTDTGTRIAELHRYSLETLREASLITYLGAHVCPTCRVLFQCGAAFLVGALVAALLEIVSQCQLSDITGCFKVILLQTICICDELMHMAVDIAYCIVVGKASTCALSGVAVFWAGSLVSSALLSAFLLQFVRICLLYTSPSPRDRTRSRMPSSA